MKQTVFLLLLFVTLLTACNQQEIDSPQESTTELPTAAEKPKSVETIFTVNVLDTVQRGDNTWELAELHLGDGQHWETIVALNPVLQEDGRIFTDTSGMVYCLVEPGQVLVTRIDSTRMEVMPMPIKKSDPEDGAAASVFTQAEMPWFIPWLFALLVIAVALLGLKKFLDHRADVAAKAEAARKAAEEAEARRLRQQREDEEREAQLNRHPVHDGVPQVEGGVSDAKAHETMLAKARVEFPGSNVSIRSMQRGTISGIAMVHFGDNSAEERRVNDLDAYRAVVTVNDVDHTRFSLQGCGNDLRAGNYIDGDELEFTPYVEIQENGEAIQIVDPGATPEVTPSGLPQPLRSEAHLQTMKGIDVARDFVNGDAMHSFVISYYESGQVSSIECQTKNVTSKKSSTSKNGTTLKKDEVEKGNNSLK